MMKINNYQLSSKGLMELKKDEGERLVAYPDIGGIWTIGVGHTGKVDNKPIQAGMTITAEKSNELLRKDIKQFEDVINSLVKVKITQNQFDALIRLIYNIGPGNFTRSTLLRELNKGNYKQAAEQFLVWNRVGKTVVKGLMNRRQREKAMFEQGD